jgi:hypothetical protein
MNIRNRGRNECIEAFASSHSWATPLDWKMHCETWDQGVEWAVRNLGSCSTLPDAQKELLAAELSYQGPEKNFNTQQAPESPL